MRTRVNLTSSSMGTSTTKTRLNVDAAYQLESGINAIHYAKFYQAATGVYTAAETVRSCFSLESGDINPNISPKRYVPDGTIGGLGVSAFGLIPVLQRIPLNISCKEGNKISAYGQSLVANTAAMRAGCTLDVSSGGTKSLAQLYYDVSGSETPAVTAAGVAAARKKLGNMTIVEAKKAVMAYMRFFPTTITASEDYIGYAEFVCSGWEATPLNFAYQPIASHLGAAASAAISQSVEEEIERTFKTQAQVVVEQYANIEEALQGDGSIIAGLVFTK